MLFSVVKGRGLLLLGGLLSLALHGLIWQFLQSEEVNAQAQMAPSYAPVRVSVSISSPAAPQEPLPQKAASKPQLKPQPQAQISKPIVPKKAKKEQAKIEQAKIVKVAKATEPKQIAKPLLKSVEKTPVVKKPEVKKPEVKKPEVKKPEVKKPEVKTSEPKESTAKKQPKTPKAILREASPTTPVQASITKTLTAESKTIMPLLNETEQKNQLIAELMRRIDQNKHYPKRALKRGIEGRVRFTLVLDRAGQLQSFEWLEGNRLFYKSTLDAIKRSLPLKLSTDQQPLNHQLALQYTISN